jgi:Putative zincin peptidase
MNSAEAGALNFKPRFGALVLSRVAAAGALIPIVAFPLVFGAVWGVDALRAGLDAYFTLPDLLILIVLFTVIHELLHAIGFLLVPGVRRDQIRFGAHLFFTTYTTQFRGEISVASLRLALALPLIVTGLLPSAVALVVGHGYAFMWAAMLTLLCSYDVMVLAAISGLPGAAVLRTREFKGETELISLPEGWVLDPEDPGRAIRMVEAR